MTKKSKIILLDRIEEKVEVAANCGHLNNLKYSKALPYVFTEHGAIMATNVLNSARAVEMGVFVVRAFVNLRRSIDSHKDFSHKLNQLENHLMGHDQQLVSIVKALKSLLSDKKVPKKRRIGFGQDDS